MVHEHAGHGEQRDLVGSSFTDDDGTADPLVRARLADPGIPVRDALGDSRLIMALAAMPDEIDDDGSVHRHMGLVSMVNATGERGLLAFTGLDSMARWDPDARPMPVSVVDAAQAVFDHGAVALVVDVMGPVRAAITGDVLAQLAASGEAGPHAH